MSGIARDEWLAALGEADTPLEPNAITAPELARQLGVSVTQTRERIRKLIEQGKARRAVTTRTNINGHACRVTGYVLLKVKKKCA
jgi:DNA-binding Lrp family transcriptional regulator